MILEHKTQFIYLTSLSIVEKVQLNYNQHPHLYGKEMKTVMSTSYCLFKIFDTIFMGEVIARTSD